MARKCSENLCRAIQQNAQELASIRLRAQQRIKELEDQRQTLLELLTELSVTHLRPEELYLRHPHKQQSFFEENFATLLSHRWEKKK